MTGSAAATRIASPPPTRPSADALRIWGASVAELHDLLWASRCVQVVRPSTNPHAVQRGPALFLLLDDTQLVLLDTRPILRKMHWSAPRVVRLRITVHDASDYDEQVTDDAERVRFTRTYGRAIRRSERAWLTADHTIANAWAKGSDARHATRNVRALVRPSGLLSLQIEGLSGSAGSDSAQDWLTAALKEWNRPNAIFPDVFEYQPGVWSNENASIAPSARFVRGAWIGAGTEIPAGTVIAGPVVFVDETTNPTPPPSIEDIDWELMRSPHWALPSLAGAHSGRRVLKRLFDLAFSLCVLVATLPIYLPIMLAILLEDGRPFFFAHRRQTLGGREFPCLKFRTMRKDAEEIKAKLAEQNSADGPQFFMKDDPRVTRVGRFLRKYQLDEFPQFLNVIAGHMSVVGPRPSPEKENQYCPTWREARLSIRPGVTGLWQVSRTREPLTDFQEWIRYDLEYVQHQSFVGDLRIIFETVRGILS